MLIFRPGDHILKAISKILKEKHEKKTGMMKKTQPDANLKMKHW